MRMPSETISQRNHRLFGTENPVAFVTGSGAPRVGRKIAEYLAEEQFCVILHANHSAESAQECVESWRGMGRVATLVTGAVEDEANVDAWLQEILSEFGRIDVVVNSAAIWDPAELETLRAADFEHYFRVNTLGTALVNQRFGLQMTNQTHGGALINIGDWAIVRPYRDFAAYFPSKGAVSTLTQSMAVELATRNPRVRVNAILPGPVLLAEEVDQQRREQLIRECLLRREGTADDVATAALFLISSPFVTGVCLPVDGGRSIYAGPSADAIAHPQVQLKPPT